MNNENILPKISEVAKIKDWLEKQTNSPNKQKIVLDGNVFNVPQKLQWDKTKYYSESKTCITPVDFVSETGNISECKYFVAETGENGEIRRGNFFIILKDKNSNDNITPELVNLENIPPGFKGTIIKYDLNDNLIASSNFDNGQLTKNADKISVRKSKNQVAVNNNAPLDPGCSYVTIDWYWQTWVNGNLVSEEYLFSTTQVVCGGGGGGGSGGNNTPIPPTPLEMCQAANQAILNDANYANTKISETVESQSQLQRTKLYAWKCVKGLGWYVIAYDRGVHTRELVTKPWKWVSLENISISKVGNTTMYGGTVTATKVLSNATIGTYHAIMHLVINIKSTTTYLNVTHTDEKDISTSKTWNSDDTGMNGY
ncbi:MAG: hypothetical protein ACKVOM_01175 [Ferruginibacter sp.]